MQLCLDRMLLYYSVKVKKNKGLKKGKIAEQIPIFKPYGQSGKTSASDITSAAFNNNIYLSIQC